MKYFKVEHGKSKTSTYSGSYGMATEVNLVKSQRDQAATSMGSYALVASDCETTYRGGMTVTHPSYPDSYYPISQSGYTDKGVALCY